MEQPTFLSSPKLSKDAKKLFVNYLHEISLYREFVPESTYEELYDDVTTHIDEKVSASQSKHINSAEAELILKTLGTVEDLVKELQVPQLIRVPLFGSFVGYKQLATKVGKYVSIVAISAILVWGSWLGILYVLFGNSGTLTTVSQEENRSKWTITKSAKEQPLEIVFPAEYMRNVYVYHGQDLKDNEVFVQFTGNNGYELKTTTVPDGSIYGKMRVELIHNGDVVATPDCTRDQSDLKGFEYAYCYNFNNPPDEDIDTSNWTTGYQEILIFVPEQLNFKGTFTDYTSALDRLGGAKKNVVEIYLQKGIVSYKATRRNEYDSNTTFGYTEIFKNSTKLGVQLDYLGVYQGDGNK